MLGTVAYTGQYISSAMVGTVANTDLYMSSSKKQWPISSSTLGTVAITGLYISGSTLGIVAITDQYMSSFMVGNWQILADIYLAPRWEHWPNLSYKRFVKKVPVRLSGF